ncbi:DUF2271 domain-containing protein [Riemerella columbipharyngis]|uniref:Flagellin biosynthesis protein FlgD n=1 Tax=Riemerella columbipharyngis TaxID=1071918 RepID=A0A1G7CM71_9FLAO|nr:DUF2271 domain-containing protein [Riemerella columbipharyngis]SDE39830.1 Predicted protein [Riemerella columbipharyngis]
MKVLKSILVLGILMAGSFDYAQTSTYKCMLQLKNYNSEDGAYIIASLVDAQGKYVKTLSVMGDERRWYHNLKEWYKFKKASKENVDAITGASVAAGNRAVKVFKIDDQYLNNGYKIKFESAVEENPYYSEDVSVPLSDEGLTQKYDGKGYIRFVKIVKN